MEEERRNQGRKKDERGKEGRGEEDEEGDGFDEWTEDKMKYIKRNEMELEIENANAEKIK